MFLHLRNQYSTCFFQHDLHSGSVSFSNLEHNDVMQIAFYLTFNDVIHAPPRSDPKNGDPTSLDSIQTNFFDVNFVKVNSEMLTAKLFHVQNENYENYFNKFCLLNASLILIIQKFSNLIKPELIVEIVPQLISALQILGSCDERGLSSGLSYIFQLHHLVLFNFLHYFFEELKSDILERVEPVLDLLANADRFGHLVNHDHLKIYISFILDVLNCPSVLNQIEMARVDELMRNLNYLFAQIHSRSNVLQRIPKGPLKESFLQKIEQIRTHRAHLLRPFPISQLNELNYFQQTLKKHNLAALSTRRRIPVRPNQNESDPPRSFSQETSLAVTSAVESLAHLRLAKRLTYPPRLSSGPRTLIKLF